MPLFNNWLPPKGQKVRHQPTKGPLEKCGYCERIVPRAYVEAQGKCPFCLRKMKVGRQ